MNGARLATLTTCIRRGPFDELPAQQRRRRPAPGVRDVLERAVATGARLPALRMRRDVRVRAVDLALAGARWRSLRQSRDCIRRGLVVVLVRRRRGRPDAVSQGCDAAQRDHLRVRLDEPRVRARARAADPARLAVRGGGVRGRARHGGAAGDRLPVDAVAPAHGLREGSGGSRTAREDGRPRRDGHVGDRRTAARSPHLTPRAHGSEPLLLHERVWTLVGPAPRLPHRRRHRRLGAGNAYGRISLSAGMVSCRRSRAR